MWGLDAAQLPLLDAHEGTEEHTREAHRDGRTVDCSNMGMWLYHDILLSLADDASAPETDGSDSAQPSMPFDEPAAPPRPAAMGNSSPVRGFGVAATSTAAEGMELVRGIVGLEEGVAPQGGAEVAPAGAFAKPHEIGSLLRGPTDVCVPAAPLRRNPLIRKKLVPANVGACVLGTAVSRMTMRTVFESLGTLHVSKGSHQQRVPLTAHQVR